MQYWNIFSRIWMENECVVKKLTSNTQKGQDTKPVIVEILVVPLFEMPEDQIEEVDLVTVADDPIVVTGDHITLE